MVALTEIERIPSRPRLNLALTRTASSMLHDSVDLTDHPTPSGHTHHPISIPWLRHSRVGFISGCGLESSDIPLLAGILVKPAESAVIGRDTLGSNVASMPLDSSLDVLKTERISLSLCR